MPDTKQRRVAVCPGSFDPVTYGHLDIISRASKLFDSVIVLVSANLEKHPVFTLTERLLMIEKVTKHFPNIVIDILEDELLADYVRRVHADAIVKGLRAVTDFEYEFQMALGNRKLCPEAETIFLTTAAENMYLSSSIVKQIAALGGDISSFVPPEIQPVIEKRLRKKPEKPHLDEAENQKLIHEVQKFANAIGKDETE
ncbi:MAG: pantetheine-phosphate adenylyltransferase [Oscillospiraceae bacterium]|nr:pantetheine-phosphate adenylyltransferase [Oscillospiraceae bacterium]